MFNDRGVYGKSHPATLSGAVVVAKEREHSVEHGPKAEECFQLGDSDGLKILGVV